MALFEHLMSTWNSRIKSRLSFREKVPSSNPDEDSRSSSSSEDDDILPKFASQKHSGAKESSRWPQYPVSMYSIILLLGISITIILIMITAISWMSNSRPSLETQLAPSIPALVDPSEQNGNGPLILYLDPTHNYTMKSPCGRSPDEARSAGCHFELFSFSWVPNECFDRNLAASFNDIRNWEFWLSKDGTGPVSQVEAETGNYDSLYTTWGYHLQHCTTMWQKMHRAVIGKGYAGIDSIVAGIAHTEHCSKKLLMQDIPMERIMSKALRGFPDCGLLLD